MEEKKYPRSFEQLKRDFEIAYSNGEEYTDLLYMLAKAIVSACAKKCIQTDSAHQLEYQNLKSQIEADYLASITDQTDYIENTAFCDGIDLIQEAVCLLLEQAITHGSDIGWLDRPYTIRTIASRALIKEADTEGYQEEITTPLQECYRTIRRTINSYQNSHSTHGSLSLDSLDSSQLDALYIACSKYTDPNKTLDTAKWDYEDLLHALNLTARQERIVTLRMQGYGYQAIATYLGISKSTVTRTLDRLKDKCMTMGISP